MSLLIPSWKQPKAVSFPTRKKQTEWNTAALVSLKETLAMLEKEANRVENRREAAKNARDKRKFRISIR